MNQCLNFEDNNDTFDIKKNAQTVCKDTPINSNDIQYNRLNIKK